MKTLFSLFLMLTGSLFSTTVLAHFTHFEPRIIHLYQDNRDTIILMRMPLPLVLLDNSWQGVDSQQAIPFTRRVPAAERTEYLLNHNEIKASLERLKQLISSGYRIKKEGQSQIYRIEAINIFNSDSRKPFSTLQAAQSNFNGVITISEDARSLFDAGLDIRLRLADTSLNTDEINISSILGDRFNAINRLANIVNLHREDETTSATTVGILDYSTTRLPTLTSKLINGFNSGFSHILIGTDHILFILLLFFSATGFLRLLSLATAFTLGHSFSLLFGHNLAISSAAFTPGIELLIALTICITAILLLCQKAQHISTTPILIIGVIHGFGFSFVFNELANEGSQTSITNLLSFNIGIEAGQLFIYGLAFVLTAMCKKYLTFKRPLHIYVSVVTLMVSAYWIVTRSIPLLETIQA
ncbi:HupE/UreJ family protein [Amphritea pacifica]|uniref:HupE/UreJ family protein n=1 Tax=Amphritea pacifica TaxID=2811233 RepID=A0ABS2W9P6_9GAMM|nr:HupE/UreJ family protein [Amphritea pacifica]MBN0988335.1 HupE/UreJ family protein [Amphritea pacifica]